MGFLTFEKTRKAHAAGPSLDLLHSLECKACPLDKLQGNRNPHIPPSGSDSPVVYVLGEAPGEDEDRKNTQFIGSSGRLLRRYIPDDWEDKLRWNNVVRTRPPGNRTPEDIEVECCRPSIVRDIEQTQPRAIFGFGNVPLKWAVGWAGITDWRGRRVPVRVGRHKCWYYPMFHPSYISRQDRDGDLDDQKLLVFELDLQRAFAEVEHLPDPEPHTQADAEHGVRWVANDLQAIKRFLAKASKHAGIAGVDYETTALRPYRDTALVVSAAVSIANSDFDETLSFPFNHSQAKWTPGERQALEGSWRDFLLSQSDKAAHNAAFELEWSAVKFGVDTVRACYWDDTMSQAAILDERVSDHKPGNLTLEFQAMLHFGFNIKSLSKLNKEKLYYEPLEKVLRYNGIDARYHRLLAERQHQLLGEQGLSQVYSEHMRRIPTTVLTQVKGVPVDFVVNAKFDKKYTERITQIEAQIADLEDTKKFERKFGYKFEPSKNHHVIKYLRDLLKTDIGEVVDKKTQKTRYSTDETILTQLDHPLGKLVLAYRHDCKQHSTYIAPLKADSSVVYPDGKIHTVISTNFAETGRTASEEPNTQNFTKRHEEGKEVRKQIKALPGHYIVSCDYGQIQVRNIAMESGDKVLCKALWDRHDFHMDWTKKLVEAHPPKLKEIKQRIIATTGKTPDVDKVIEVFRTDVKNQWTFPLFFGASVRSVSAYLSIPEQVISPLYDEFWETFEGVHAWQNKLWDMYQRKGYVENLTGRRRRAPLTRNQVFNSPIQGDEADIVLGAMNALSEMGDWDLQAVLEVHDDLTFMLPDHRLEHCLSQYIIPTMLFPKFDFITVPITVDIAVGPNWCDLAKGGVFESDRWEQ